MLFYSTAWNHQNEILYTPENYREYVINQNKKLIQKIERGKKPEMVKYLRAYPLDISTYTNSYIRRQNLVVHELYKKTKNEVVEYKMSIENKIKLFYLCNLNVLKIDYKE